MFRKRGGEEGRKVSSFQLRYLSTNLSFYANSFRKYTHDCIDFHECPPFLLNENDNRRSSSTLIKKKRKKKNEITFYYWNKQRAQFLRQLSLHTGCVTLWLLRRMLVPRDGNGARSRPLNNGQFYHWQWIMTPLSLSYAKIRLLVGGQNIVCGGYLRGGGRARVELSTKVRLRLPPRSTLLSYCIVSTPRCAVLEQVFSPFTFAPFSRSRRPSLPSCFVIASPLLLLTSLSSSLPGHSTLSSSRAALAKLRVFRALNSYGLRL